MDCRRYTADSPKPHKQTEPSCLAALAMRVTPPAARDAMPPTMRGGPKGPSGTPHRTAALAAPTPPATPILLAVSVAACFPDLRLRFQCRKFSTPATGTSVTAAKIPPRTALPAAEYATAVKAEVRFADLGAATSAGFMFLPTRVRFMRACSQTTLLGYLARSGALAIDLIPIRSDYAIK